MPASPQLIHPCLQIAQDSLCQSIIDGLNLPATQDYQLLAFGSKKTQTQHWIKINYSNGQPDIAHRYGRLLDIPSLHQNGALP